jgi:hypothetical protein
MAASGIINALILSRLDDLGEELVASRMERATDDIVKRMVKKDMTLEQAQPKPVIRDALFRLWRSVIPSGDIADFIRDQQDDDVVAEVEPKLGSNKDLKNLVTLTREATLDKTF